MTAEHRISNLVIVLQPVCHFMGHRAKDIIALQVYRDNALSLFIGSIRPICILRIRDTEKKPCILPQGIKYSRQIFRSMRNGIHYAAFPLLHSFLKVLVPISFCRHQIPKSGFVNLLSLLLAKQCHSCSLYGSCLQIFVSCLVVVARNVVNIIVRLNVGRKV